MGFFGAIGACYANMFNFTGRARRAEYWYFFLFQVLIGIAIQVAATFYLFDDPMWILSLEDPAQMDAWMKANPQIWTYAAYAFAANVILIWLPNLSVTFRRLHDTNHSGWFILMPLLAAVLSGVAAAILSGMSAVFGQSALSLALMVLLVPIVASIWFWVVLCLPGTRGNNRYGPDPVPYDQRRPSGDHPAFQRDIDPKLRREIQAAQRQQFEDYYKARVLPAIEQNKSNRV